MVGPSDSNLAPAEGAPEPYGPGYLIRRKYRLGRLLAEGGMGEVWLAHNRALDAPVALKLIRVEMRDAVASERLLREARAAARLRHPSIVRVFDFGVTQAGDPYIVMELLEGVSLRDALDASGPMPATRAVSLLLPVAHALASAHAAGVVHRDLKPENIVLCSGADGAVEPKVVDFGIAKILRPAPGGTSTGAAQAGTPAYMSPEQILGLDALDGRSDVWAFCVVLHELLSNAFPFDGSRHEDIFRAVLKSPAPPLAGAEVDAELAAIVARGLCKDRDGRWGSMRELGRALASWLVARGVDEDATGASLRVRWLDRLSGSAAGGAKEASKEAGRLPPGRPADAPADAERSEPPEVQWSAGTSRALSATWPGLRPRILGLPPIWLASAGLAVTLGMALVVGPAPAGRAPADLAASAGLPSRARQLGLLGRAHARAGGRDAEARVDPASAEGGGVEEASAAPSPRTRRRVRRLRPEEIDFGF